MTSRIDFDRYTSNYNQLLNENTRFFSKSEEYFAKYKVDIAHYNINHTISRVLEYGCGIGRNIPFLKAAFPNAAIVGSDISMSSLDMAREQNPEAEFFYEDNKENKIVTPFDLIFVAGVFHHIPPLERAKVASILFERLSPLGQIIIFEHNPFNPITRRIVNRCPYDEDAVLLKPKELKKHLQQAGFSVTHQSYCLFIPPRFSKLVFIEGYLGWLPLGGQYWIQAKRDK